jgi:4-carboxymuconolactone decarboxylase
MGQALRRLVARETIVTRIPPITGKSDVAESDQHVVDQVLEVFGRVRGPFSVLLHSPTLAERLLQLVRFNRNDTIVEPQLRLIAVLAAVREREAAYVWAAQVEAARRVGLREAVIDLLREKGDPAGLPQDEHNIVVYVRQLMRTNRVDQAVFDALHRHHGAQWLVELTAAANFYTFLCGMVNAFEVPAPPDGDPLT